MTGHYRAYLDVETIDQFTQYSWYKEVVVQPNIGPMKADLGLYQEV